MIYEIANLKVEMNPKYERLMRQSVSYESSGAPVIRIAPDPNDESRVVMNRPSQGEREYICCSAAFCRKIVRHGRFFLHASAVVYEGEAYLFSAPSGTGKSTHTAFWRELFPGSYILNDDKPVIWPDKEQITVWGTPFAGKTNLQVNRGVPLKGICFLHQGNEDQIQEITEDRALALLLDNTYRPGDNGRMNLLLDMMERVVSQIHIYEMISTGAGESPVLSYRAMKGSGLNE